MEGGFSAGGGDGEADGCEEGVGGEELLAGLGVGGAALDAGAGFDGFGGADGVRVETGARVFDHEDGVGAGRDGGAGVDGDALVFGQRGGMRRAAGVHGCYNMEWLFRDEIGRADGETVELRAVERRGVDVEADRLGKHAAEGIGEADGDGRQRRSVGVDGILGLLDG